MESGIKHAGPSEIDQGQPAGSRGNGLARSVVAKAKQANEHHGNEEHRPHPDSDHIIAVGGAGSLGSPALVSGKKISKAASITSTPAARR